MKQSDAIDRAYKSAVRAGSIPYKANRAAVKAIDIEEDGPAGLDEIGLFLRTIDVFERTVANIGSVAHGVQNVSS